MDELKDDTCKKTVMNKYQNFTPEERFSIMSNAIDWLRFPMAFMVILIHLNPERFLSPTTIGEYTYNFMSSALSKVIPQIAVPLFFLISGYLYFININSLNRGGYLKKSKSRVKTLLLPYLYWNIIAFGVPISIKTVKALITKGGTLEPVMTLIRENGFHIFWDSKAWSGGWWCFGLLHSPENIAPYDLPLWFVRNLIILLAITPILYYLLKRVGKVTIIILGIAYISKIWIQYPPLNITGIYFFTMGSYLSVNRLNLAFFFDRYSNFFKISAIISCIICTVLFSLGLSRISGAIMPIYILSGVITTICVASDINKSKVTKSTKIIMSLAPTSFFIFAIHTVFILTACKRLSYKIFHVIIKNNEVWVDILVYFTTPLLVVCISLSAFYLMKRFTPLLLSSLTGNRM